MKEPVPLPTIYALGGDRVYDKPMFVAIAEDGKSFYGHQSDVIQGYLDCVAFDAETKEAGAGLKGIRAFNRFLGKAHAFLPLHARVVVDIEKSLRHGQFYRDAFKELADRLIPSDQVREGVLKTTWGRIIASGLDVRRHPFNGNISFSLPSGVPKAPQPDLFAQAA